MNTKGTIVSVNVDDNSIVLAHNGAPTETHEICLDSVITVSGEESLLSDLKVGDYVELSGYIPTIVTATR